MSGREALKPGRAVARTIVAHPGEADPAALKRIAETGQQITGEGVKVNAVKRARRNARLLVAVLDRRGYLSPAGREALAPLLK
jgi:hypothetical protein